MKKLSFILLSALFAMTTTAQTVGEAFYIYRNDGGFNAFFRESINYIDYSCYDLDSVLHDDYVTQVVHTWDSIYRIPLEVIDSVAFVTPKPEYADGVVELSGDLFSYVTAVDGLCLTLSPSTPKKLLPKVGDKIATMELTEMFPDGFLGKVTDISQDGSGITVCCESIFLTEAVKRFYAAIRATNEDSYYYAPKRRAEGDESEPESGPTSERDILHIDLPSFAGDFELSALIREKDVYEYSGKAKVDYQLYPNVIVDVTIALDEERGLHHLNARVGSSISGAIEMEIAGEIKNDIADRRLKKFIDKDFPLPYGLFIYLSSGFVFEYSGECAIGATLYPYNVHTLDITGDLYSLGNFRVFVPGDNAVRENVRQGCGMEWDYFAGRIEGKAGVYGRVGFGWGSHQLAWVGGEVEAGVKATAELELDMATLREADRSTVLYETINELCKADIVPYVGWSFVASAAADHFQFKHGRDYEREEARIFKGRLLPSFDDTMLSMLGPRSVTASARVTNDCLIPFSIGFTAFDADDKKIDTQYYTSRYWNRYSSSFNPYKVNFKSIDASKIRKVYPTINVLGYDMLATPSNLEDRVETLDLKPEDVGAFGATLRGRVKDYKPEEKGRVLFYYGKVIGDSISSSYNSWNAELSEDGSFETRVTRLDMDSTYYYVAVYMDTLYVSHYGKMKTFTTRLCPDDHHPHAIDLGLPSGTKWACCNVGASKPEDFGGYYAWGETETKSDYSAVTYKYYHGQDKDGDGYFDYGTQVVIDDIGSEISGTSYDVAQIKWGSGWCMPSQSLIKEMCGNTPYDISLTLLNGVYGCMFKGLNGNAVFLPTPNSFLYYNSPHYYGNYWSSSLYSSGAAYYLGITQYNSAYYNFYHDRSNGSYVRPVRKN